MQKMRGRTYVVNPITGQSPIGGTAVAGEKSLFLAYPSAITTTGDTDVYGIAPCTGMLVSAIISAVDALAGHDSNYLTFTLVNKGQAGAGSTAMLAATNPNTTKATGGTAIGANTIRTLTVHGTPANLAVTAGDRLLFKAAATGTLANQLTYATVLLKFSETA